MLKRSAREKSYEITTFSQEVRRVLVMFAEGKIQFALVWASWSFSEVVPSTYGAQL